MADIQVNPCLKRRIWNFQDILLSTCKWKKTLIENKLSCFY